MNKELILTDAEQTLVEEYQREHKGERMAWYIQAISFVGAFFAGIMFTGFLAMLQIWESEVALLITGLILLGVGLFFSHTIKNKPTVDPFIIMTLILGQVYTTVGIVLMNEELFNSSTQDILVMMGVVGIILHGILFVICPLALQRFISTISFGVSLMLLGGGDHVSLIASIVVGGAVIVLFIMERSEPLLISLQKSMGEIAQPLRYGLLILVGGTIITFQHISSFTYNRGDYGSSWWIATILVTCSLLLLLIKSLKAEEWFTSKVKVVTIISLLAVAGISYNTPGILVALFIMAMGFIRSSKLLLTFGTLYLLTFLFYFYYALHTTLLIKSFVLMGSGTFLLVLYGVIQKIYPQSASLEGVHNEQ